MSDLRRRIADLSPSQRAFLQSRLLQKSAATAQQTIPRRSASDRCPLSFAQQRLWFLQQLEPEDVSYNLGRTIRLRGAVDAGALRRALEAVVARHEALRTSFVVVEGQPTQVISAAPSVPLPVEDLTALPEPETSALRRVHEEARRPFDLTYGPLLRARLLRLDEREHLLLLSMHHIVSDAWSMGVLWRELGTLYDVFSTGEPSPLAELPLQYADFAVWQREWLRGEALDKQLAYWKRQLDGVATLQLPTDHPRPAVQVHRGGRQELMLPEPLTEALKELSRREGVTLFMTLLAAFKALLARHSGQDDIAVGSPIAGRNRVETEALIGFFVNTLVLRTNLSGDPTFRELLGRVRETALGAYTHQDLPFEKLVEELQPERDLSRTPLFQVFLNMHNAGDSAIELGRLAVETVPLLEDDSKFDLTLYVEERRGSIRLALVYNADLFERTTAEQMLGHFKTLLEGIVADPERRLSSFSLLTAPERRRLSGRGSDVDEGVRPTNPFTGWTREEIEQSIPRRFEQQVRKHPHNIAVKTWRHEWTYVELNAAASRAARTILARRGDEADEPARIALLFEHGAPMIAGLLGTLKAGKTYVPLDASYPQERLDYMLQDAQANAILTNGANLALAKTLAEGEIQLINIDDLGLIYSSDSSADTEDFDLDISPESVAYILYTSGSTGRPKGVVQSHRNVLHFIRVYTNNLHISAEDRLTLLSSYSFDAAVMDIFGALLNGATLYPIDIKDEGLEALAERLVEQGITIYHSTPTIYRYFIGSLRASSKVQKFPELRLVALGGEAANQKDVERYKAHFPAACLFVNGLGPAESSVSLQYFVDQRTPLALHAVPVGYVVEDTEVLLLDEASQEAEVYGEIAIRSPHVALGYWRSPELTRKVFMPDPAGGDGRVCRTGDMGRLLPDGAIEWRGRRDHQVKLRGYRIELGEIETVLDQHPSVRESVVVVRGQEPDEQRLAAFVVPASVAPPSHDELRTFLSEKLPDYMAPSAFVVLEALPLTPNGKVDRRALPAPEQARPESETSFVDPRTPTEATLASIWASVLRLQQVSARGNFFELGGHSLLATQVVSRVRDAFGVELPLRALFDAPTVAGLAERIEAVRRSDPAPSVPTPGLLGDRDEGRL